MNQYHQINKIKRRVWGVYDDQWNCKSASQLHNEEVLPRLRRYLELGERRLGFFEKQMSQLEPYEILSIVASVNACASAIFQRCTTVRGQWQRSYEPDVSSPTNQEKLKKFRKIISNHPNEALLPLLEQLASTGESEYAYQILRTIRKMAHINKKIPKSDRTNVVSILANLPKSTTPPGSPPTDPNTPAATLLSQVSALRPTPRLSLQLQAEESLRNMRRSSEPNSLPSHVTPPTTNTLPSLLSLLNESPSPPTPSPAPQNSQVSMMQELAMLRQELAVTRERLRWYEMQEYHMRVHNHNHGQMLGGHVVPSHVMENHVTMNSIPIRNS